MAQERPFKEIHVANFSVQRRSDRYPKYNRYRDTDEDNVLDYTGEGYETPEGDGEPPRIALYRSNLVALSQNFNLYFAAYRDKVHCYVPRDLKQTLPSQADLILDLPRSDYAKNLGGFISKRRPHCVNQMIVGNLGNLEILLAATDDGDVIAFYTHILLRELKTTGSTKEVNISKARPFFHQSVDGSAWGLAIHQKSRLIAVSCNPGVVTVFVHSIRDEISKSDSVDDLSYAAPSNDEFPFVDYYSCPPPEAFKQRRHNFRLSPVLGEDSNNIPSIAFSSDSNDEAKFVLAVDICGNLWILGIWENTVERLEGILHKPYDTLHHRRAWGVLALPLENFKLTAMPHEAFGFRDIDRKMARDHRGQDFDITSTTGDIRDNSKNHPAFGFGIRGPGSQCTGRSVLDTALELTLESDGESDGDEMTGRSRSISSDSSDSSISTNSSSTSHSIASGSLDFLSSVAVRQIRTASRRETFATRLKARAATQAEDWTNHTAILRCYSDDVELIPPAIPPLFKTIIRRPLWQVMPLETGLERLLDIDRLNLLASIPELNLVVVGSQIGRVLLLTLTKLKGISSRVGPVVMFRLDLILPFHHHEANHRPACPLLGMAVSPLQSSGCSEMQIRGRWRLILHYYDHTILSYELGREEDGDGLMVASDGLRFRV